MVENKDFILTGKAKEDFINYLWNSNFEKEDYKEYEDYLCNQKESYTYSDIIEFFDSVGLYIHIEPSIAIGYEKADCFLFRINNMTERLKFYSRQEATTKALEKANEIFNNR